MSGFYFAYRPKRKPARMLLVDRKRYQWIAERSRKRYLQTHDRRYMQIHMEASRRVYEMSKRINKLTFEDLTIAMLEQESFATLFAEGDYNDLEYERSAYAVELCRRELLRRQHYDENKTVVNTDTGHSGGHGKWNFR